ncbi:ATP-binding protein [Amycolatopsis roodepoortensis]|uniref:ATP-binding protein n=1 Tax=Amycolatopsis roodepoortensis TaxID=700274 RepID=UPI00214B14D1|nr:ATP-binding protein [Amycolatopsis roodepoortensis]UUV32156.1 ATP-binding protein [Amycolatopsis roodepoortensis]
MSAVSIVSVTGVTGQPLALTATVVDGSGVVILGHQGHRIHPELRDRVYAAVRNSRTQPGDDRRRVEVRIDQESAGPDAAAVATAVLAARLGTPRARLLGTAVLGELGLDGSLRPVRGVLRAAQTARARGIYRIIVPAATLDEASVVDGLDVLGAHTLTEIADWLRGDDTVLHRPSAPIMPVTAPQPWPVIPLTPDVLRAVTVAAAGGHHLLCETPHDAGGLHLVSWLHALLPDLTRDQQLEVAAIQSLLGPREDGAILVSTPPLTVTHHSDRLASLIGGHQPGQVSRAHLGVLFAPDVDQFATSAQESLRAVLLNREAHLRQHDGDSRYPAGLQLVATAVRTSRSQWLTPPALRDTIDIRLAATHLIDVPVHGPQIASITRLLERTRAQVAVARDRAASRWRGEGLGAAVLNAQVPREHLHTTNNPDTAARIRRACEAGRLTLHGGDIVLRLAWTLADLDGAPEPTADHLDQALTLRNTSAAIPPDTEVR